ncbi:MAG: thioredoxin domain-containing protein [Cytophagales bacterium]|nr:thioredoxin domain-containing protein [Cytophagales bacterium]
MEASKENQSPNRLVKATSPYLQQHAYNPVDWHEWGEEALQKAKNEDKPILVSIGYSSCHWCHVMERESFENPDVASIMNEHLVCIKVDREERPDIDQVYMDAVQAMGLNGGWPLNVFLTPEQKPFFGGTYFPPKNWVQLILQLAKAFQQRREEIDRSAEDLTVHLASSDLSRFASEEGPFERQDFDATFSILTSRFDTVFGGLDKAPKFVMPSIWMWLLRYHHLSQTKGALDMVLLTLRQLAMGGIYDQLGGGFARYSVDGRWFAPHFEKMLYDNAQLMSLYAEAYRVSPDPLFRDTVVEINQWLNTEMTHPDGGFYSALDADSEGEEGKFYTWTEAELDKILGDESGQFKSIYQVTSGGNWEKGWNILFRKNTEPEGEWLEDCKKKLLRERSKRIRPGLDDKVIAGWNAMMIQGLLDAYDSFGDNQFLEQAENAIAFLENNMMDGPRCQRTFKAKASETEGFLEDYAYLTQAYLSLYQSTFNDAWLHKAARECDYILANFWDEKEGFFFYAGGQSEQLIARKKEVFDNVIPSSNSVMARNLLRLGQLLDRDDWTQKAVRMGSSLKKLILTEPSYMSHWGILALEITQSFHEVVIAGPSAMQMRAELAASNLPFSLILGTTGASNLPLVQNKTVEGKTLIYVCVNKTCKQPVATVHEALVLLKAIA